MNKYVTFYFTNFKKIKMDPIGLFITQNFINYIQVQNLGETGN